MVNNVSKCERECRQLHANEIYLTVKVIDTLKNEQGLELFS